MVFIDFLYLFKSCGMNLVFLLHFLDKLLICFVDSFFLCQAPIEVHLESLLLFLKSVFHALQHEILVRKISVLLLLVSNHHV